MQAPAPKKKEMHPLDAEGSQKLLALAIGHQDYAAVYADLHTGLRRGELLGLRWKDVDIARKVAQVQQILEYTKDRGHFFGPPKTKAGRRSVPLPAGVVALLKDIKKKQAANRLKYGQRYKDFDLIFCQDNGTPEVPDNVSSRFKRLAAKAGFPEMCLHDFRHYGKRNIIAIPLPPWPWQPGSTPKLFRPYSGTPPWP
ncbi:MAG: site-specific integrase [Eubacteriales bacterium]